MRATQYNPVITDYGRSFPFYVCTIGTAQRQKPVYRRDGVQDDQILYTVRGEGRAEVGGETCILRPRTILFSPKQTLHFYAGNTEDWQTKWITFNGETNLFRGRRTEVWELPEDFHFESYYYKILQYRKTKEWEVKSSAVLYELLLNCRDFSTAKQASVYFLKNRLVPAMNYIYAHYREEIELSLLAAEIGVSEEHFCRIFKELTSMRPFEYITDLRIQSAKTILFENPSRKIEEVARDCGYQSASYFIKKFKEREHMPPQKYRDLVLSRKEYIGARKLGGL